jgi:hypothetical protein
VGALQLSLFGALIVLLGIYLVRQPAAKQANLLKELLAEILGVIVLLLLCATLLVILIWLHEKGYIWQSRSHP